VSTVIEGVASPCAVAVDGAHVYWKGPLDNRIGRASLNATDVDPDFIPLDGPWNVGCGIAVDGTHLYWADQAYKPNFFTCCSSYGPPSIARANLDGSGADKDFISGPACGVAVDGRNVYWSRGESPEGSIGRANLDGSGVDRSFISGQGLGCGGVTVDSLSSPPPESPPSNEFSFGKVKRNKRKGTAKLTVKVPGPGELELAETKRVNGKQKRAESAGKQKLPIKSRRKARKKLNAKGRAKVNAKVTYTPEGGDPSADSKKIKLVKR
jgi:hypothetical protein